ncbi:MAG TPA: TolC family protein [Thermoanaerobacterales bacterium]|jgi:outer membrane protein TolC|nr:TolC family protein [Thermoanaerobacterales bacterium]
MKSKRLLAFLIMTIMLFMFPISSFAAEAEEEVDINAKEKFSIEECIEVALENNRLIKIKAEDYEKSKIERSEAKSLSDKIDKARDRLKGIPIYYVDALTPMERIKLEQGDMKVFSFEGVQGKDIAPRLKEAEELVAQKELELEKQNVRIEVERAYYNVLLAEDNIRNAEVQLDRSREQHKNAKVSYDNGIIAKDALLLAQTGLASAEQNLSTAKLKCSLAKMNLNKQMGRDLTAPLILTTRFTYEPQQLQDVQSMVDSALRLRPEVINVREMSEVASLNERLALKYYAENTYIYQKAKSDAQRAALGLKETEDAIAFAVRAAYINAQETAEKLDTVEKLKQQCAEAYRITELKYKYKTATTAELLEAQEKLNQAELAYTSAVFDYNVAVAELENWAGKGLE